MNAFMTKITNLFYKAYKPEVSGIELACIIGGACIDCVDETSDFDILFVSTPSTREKEIWTNVGNIKVSFLGNTNWNWNIYSRLFAWFITEDQILYSTPVGCEQLEWYKSDAINTVFDWWTGHIDWVNSFLADESTFRKELYHFVYCWDIITEGTEKVDRALLLEMKRGRANNELRQWLIKVGTWVEQHWDIELLTNQNLTTTH